MSRNCLSRARQRGMTFIGMLFIGGILAVTFVVGAQVAPTVIEYIAISKAVQKASTGGTVAEIRKIYEAAAAIDDMSSVDPRDLEITKENDRVVVRFSYKREIHLAGPAYLVMKYNGRSK